MEIDHDTSTVRFDWHRFAPDQVEVWADRIVEAAWRHGFERVEFVHGASDVSARGTIGWKGEGVTERGSIKAMLRTRLYRGHWRRWVEEVRSGRHDIAEGHMVLALRENPKPDPRARWPVVPPPAY